MKEFRSTRKVEVRSTRKGRVLTGYAIVFSPAVSQDLGGFKESVDPNAANIAAHNIWALRGHDSNKQLGSTSSKTLRLYKDSRGIRFELDLPDTQDGNDLAALYANGDGGQCSFGFTTNEDTWSQLSDGTVHRLLLDIDVFEISVGIISPAYTDTTAALRSCPPSLRAKLKRNDDDDQLDCDPDNPDCDDLDSDLYCECDDPDLRCIRCDESRADCECESPEYRCTRCLRDWFDPDDEDDDPDDDTDDEDRALLVTLLQRRAE